MVTGAPIFPGGIPAGVHAGSCAKSCLAASYPVGFLEFAKTLDRRSMMKTRFNKKLLPLVLASVLAMSSVHAQDTTSGVTGRVLDASGNPVAGAKVHIVHVPSGT